MAERGIHPPEEMPFELAWTDTMTVESVVEYHLTLRRDWSPEAWDLALGVWCQGRLAGSQSIRATRFADERRVVTGSWLGRPFQRQGIGTEMRTAVLELAFRGLGARVAVSGALEGNAASRRVSDKLGYRVTGEGFYRPRGEPLLHVKLELTAGEWQPPFAVELDGLAPCLALFGL